jgi:nucleosome-remodeling factor subunit BPTF
MGWAIRNAQLNEKDRRTRVDSQSLKHAFCLQLQLHGVTDCLSEVEKSGLLIRQDPLGYDRHRRKYWFIARRVIIETDNSNEIVYYSSKLQLDALMQTLDPIKYEKRLVRNISEQYDEIVRCMNITEELTDSRKDSKKSYFQDENGKLSAAAAP